MSSGVPAEKRYLNVKESALYMSCSIWKVRTLAYERAVPFAVLGNRFVFDRHDLDKYVESQKMPVAA